MSSIQLRWHETNYKEENVKSLWIVIFHNEGGATQTRMTTTTPLTQFGRFVAQDELNAATDGEAIIYIPVHFCSSWEVSTLVTT